MGVDSKTKRKRRTCVDEWRHDLARHRERRSDPAGKAMLQLLALLSAVLALAFDIPSLRRRSRYDPPTGYALGREAWARERGLDPEPTEAETATERPTPRLWPEPRPWRQLVRDLESRSPQRRESARELLAQRVPEAAREWLRQVIASEDRTQLRMLGLNASPAVLRERALHAARVASTPEPESAPWSSPEVDVAPSPGRR